MRCIQFLPFARRFPSRLPVQQTTLLQILGGSSAGLVNFSQSHPGNQDHQPEMYLLPKLPDIVDEYKKCSHLEDTLVNESFQKSSSSWGLSFRAFNNSVLRPFGFLKNQHVQHGAL